MAGGTATEAGGHLPGGGHDEEEHEEHVNHEAWVIPYADMVTLLMALFLMLYALSTLDLKKFEALASSLNTELSGGSSDVIQPLDGDPGGPEPIDLEGSAGARPTGKGGPGEELVGSDVDRAAEALEREEALEQARLVEARSLDEVRDEIASHVEAAGLGSAVEFEQTPRGLVVTVVSDQVLFEPGSAQLQAAGREVLSVVADAVRSLPNDLAVEGHTDDRPIATAEFPSNWELSTERATQVLRELIERRSIPASRVSAAGYGDQRPVASNDTASGRARNRRVELVVLTEIPRVVAP